MLTVLMPSRNGANTLSEVLPAYCELESPPGGWKLVIIDNGSNDETEAIVSSFQTRLPLTYLFESTPGKNAALNLGLTQVQGDLVVFSDDDSIPHQDWLVQMRAVCDANPSFTVFAGKVRPRWQKTPADWIFNWVPLGPTFTLSDTTLTEGPTEPCNVFGPNMAVRKEVFDSGDRFCVSIGPSGKSYPMGSETELVRRLVSSGFRCWYSPKVVVEHLIDEEHLGRPWILQRAILYGRGRYRIGFLETPREYPSWFGVPRFLFKQFFKHGVRMICSAILWDQRQMFLAQWELSFCLGQAVEARKIGIEKSLSPG